VKTKQLRFLGYGITILLIANLVLFALGRITLFVFWSIIIAGVLFIYVILPKIKKQA